MKSITKLTWTLGAVVLLSVFGQLLFIQGYKAGQLNYAQGLVTYTVRDGYEIHILGKVKPDANQ